MPMTNSDLRSDNSITIIAPQLTHSPSNNKIQRTGSSAEDEEMKRERSLFMSQTKSKEVRFQPPRKGTSLFQDRDSNSNVEINSQISRQDSFKSYNTDISPMMQRKKTLALIQNKKMAKSNVISSVPGTGIL